MKQQTVRSLENCIYISTETILKNLRIIPSLYSTNLFKI